ncbi:MAG: Rrf2 family transcriptional regulator [Candidatus Cloacimonetes bacterium]|nr:Rrf2 family transcriptional regulator [Candidatus Cloacimonadota bacterium]
MNNLIHISEAASLALHGLAFIVSHDSELVNIKTLAEKLDASEAHLAKVFQKLAKAGIIKSTRGPKGGFLLKRNPEDLTFLDIYETVEAKVIKTSCPMGKSKCIFKKCIFTNQLGDISEQLYNILVSIKLSSFANNK